MKKLLIPALLLAGAISSCSENNITDVYPTSDDTNSIGLDIVTSITRAKDTQTQDLRDAGAVTLYYSDGTTNGSIPFVYKSGEWENSNGTKWSKVLGNDLTGTATFYSMNRGADATANNADFALTSVSAASATSGVFTPEATLADQYDLAYYTGEISAIPANGNITADFHHALSRVEMYCDMGTNTTYVPYVKNVYFYNVKDSGTATITNKDYDANVLNISWTAGTTTTNYTFFDLGTALDGQEMEDTKLVTASAGDYASTDASDAIIIPQKLAESTSKVQDLKNNATKPQGYFGFKGSPDDPTTNDDETVQDSRPDYNTDYFASTDAGLITDPVVYSLYRMTDGTLASAANIVGVANVAASSEYDRMRDPNDKVFQPILPATHFDTDVDGVSTVKSEYANAPLFVLAAFPFSSELTLLPNYDYDFLLGYGTTGGLLASDYYFFGDGTMTNIPIEGQPDPGDTILPGLNTIIGLRVIMKHDWENGGEHELDGK